MSRAGKAAALLLGVALSSAVSLPAWAEGPGGTAAEPAPSAIDEAPAAPVAPDLAGDWRMDLYVVSHARIPVLGTTTILAHTLFQATVDGAPGAQVLHTRPCRLNPQTTRPIATTIVPQAFVDHLPSKHVPLVMSQAPDGGWRFTGDMQPQDVGWTRKRYTPTRGALVPQDKEHPAVLDFEGDGHPGATVHLDAPLFGNIEIYVVQTAHTKLAAEVGDAQVIEGHADPQGFGQRTIGASNRLFVSNPDITLDPAQSSFRLARVPTGTSCGTLASGTGAGTPILPDDVKPRD
jgi:hypothetical protein